MYKSNFLIKSCQKRQFAFTLAEVLIVLGIIGIVAEMTIPTLMNNVQSQVYKSSWKKAVSAASQSYVTAVNDNGDGFGGYAAGTPAAAKWNGFKAQFRIIKDCAAGGTVGNCWGAKLTTPDPGGGCANFQGANFNANSSFVSADGMFWMLYGDVNSYPYPIVAVDVNGAKGPNKWGVDSFSFQLNDTDIGDYGSCINDNGNSKSYLLQ